MTIADSTPGLPVAIGIIVPLLLLWVVAYVDLARRRDLASRHKALWATVMLVSAYIGVAAYFILRPGLTQTRKTDHASDPESSANTPRLEVLQEQYASGELAEDTYLSRKRDVLGLT